jgi:hypothetical protein
MGRTGSNDTPSIIYQLVALNENIVPSSTYIHANWHQLPRSLNFLRMLRRFVTPSLAVGGAAVASYYGYQLYATAALPSTFRIKTANQIPDSFTNSFAVSTVNPHSHISFDDSRSIIVSVSKHLTHERILAEFLRGFFGGYAFAPEAIALRLLGKKFINLKGACSQVYRSTLKSDSMEGSDGVPASRQVWKAAEISTAGLPPLNSVLFGAFRIIDISLSSSSHTQLETFEARSSQVDIAYGSDNGFIAGVHRFSVSESEGSADLHGKRHVTINFDSTSCNPKENKQLGPDLLMTFHMWYAMLLFKEAVGSVIKAA